jgi:glyoxylase-like metal-dependent hydrolase (beta-lactamase superfamily II)
MSLQAQVGQIRIQRIVEQEAPFFHALQFFPSLTDELLDVNRGWLQPTFLDAEDKLILCIQSYVVHTPRHKILIDTCVGNHKPRPNRPFWHMRTSDQYEKNLAAAGLSLDDIDFVLCTHLHPDHVGGLSPANAPAFPNAELVLAEPEYAFWTDEGIASRAPADFQPFFRLAQEAVKPYANRTRRMNAGEVAPGIALEAAPGHTPGHSMVRIASGAAQLLIWGDVVHMAALQFEKPDWSLAFDTDQGRAAETRKRVFDMAATDKLLVAGMHLPFPGLGRVARRGDAYAYAPEPWQG